MTDKFVRHARTLLSTGGSARSTLEQLHLNAGFFLSEKEYAMFIGEVPSLRWFQYHREGLGLESYLYTLMRIAKCERVLQWGFDETSLDGIGTLNQWVRIEEAGDVHVLTLECAGLLSGGTASKVGEHVKVFWERGRVAMSMLRELLGDAADTYVPLVNGGITLSKLCGVMHDTCNSANKIARTVRVLRDESGTELYGEEEWRRMLGDHEREWLDFLCGNHSRNLHFDAFLRLFQAYIKASASHIPTHVLASRPVTLTLNLCLSFFVGETGTCISGGACKIWGTCARRARRRRIHQIYMQTDPRWAKAIRQRSVPCLSCIVLSHA